MTETTVSTTGFFRPIGELHKASKALTMQQKICLARMILEDAEALARKHDHEYKFDIIEVVDDLKQISIKNSENCVRV